MANETAMTWILAGAFVLSVYAAARAEWAARKHARVSSEPDGRLMQVVTNTSLRHDREIQILLDCVRELGNVNALRTSCPTEGLGDEMARIEIERQNEQKQNERTLEQDLSSMAAVERAIVGAREIYGDIRTMARVVVETRP